MEDAVVVTVKTVKVLEPETMKSCWRKLYPDVVHDFTGFTTEPVKEIMKEIVDMAKRVGGGRFQDTDPREIQEIIDTT